MNTTIPREIKGRPGSRVRVIFGGTGSEWLLLLNEDDGNRERQRSFWKSIPSHLESKVNTGENVKEMDFGPTGACFLRTVKRDGIDNHNWWDYTAASSEIKDRCGWNTFQAQFGSDALGRETYALVQGSGRGYCLSGNINYDLADRVERIRREGKTIDFVRLFENGTYFISDSDGTEWSVKGIPFSNELKKARERIEEVACAGDGSWLIVTSSGFEFSEGVDPELTNRLSRFFREHREFKARRDNEIQAARQRKREAEAAAQRRAEEEARDAADRERQAREAEERARLLREQQAAEEARLAAEEEAKKSETRYVTLLQEEAEVIGKMEELVRKRKRSLQETLRDLPAAQRERFDLNDASTTGSSPPQCVVCQERDVGTRAIIPCGHHCLCETCSNTLIFKRKDAFDRKCPLCRGYIRSMLKIYTSSA